MHASIQSMSSSYDHSTMRSLHGGYTRQCVDDITEVVSETFLRIAQRKNPLSHVFYVHEIYVNHNLSRGRVKE